MVSSIRAEKKPQIVSSYSKTAHFTGIASSQGTDVQSVLQKVFGVDKDPFVTERQKEAMNG